MKTMFSMGFTPQLFGSRILNPTLGAVVPLPRRMGDTLSGDELLKQLAAADAQVGSARKYVADHPDQDAALGNDYVMFNTWMSTADSAQTVVSDVQERLSGIGPGGQIEVTSEEVAVLKNYMEAGKVLSDIVARHAPKVAPTGPKPAASAPAAPKKNDLTAPLLVGGGVLAIGVIALLARV